MIFLLLDYIIYYVTYDIILCYTYYVLCYIFTISLVIDNSSAIQYKYCYIT